MLFSCLFFYFLKILFIYFWERGREGEKHQCMLASYVAPIEDLACNPGMRPGWEWNQWPFGLQPALNSLSYTSQDFSLAFKSLSLSYLFLEKGMDGERMGEKHQRVVASHTPHTGDLACNPGMCPDWESNQRPFGSQASAQSSEPYQTGLLSF